MKTCNHPTKILGTAMLLALLLAVLFSGCGDGVHSTGPIPDTSPPAALSGLAVAADQLPVALGSTTSYAVIAGATITNTGATKITGDLGLSPGSAVTGFPPGIIVGRQHVGDPSAVQAKLDLTTAYNNAAGRTLAPVSVSGNIGGMTLAPGLYKSTSGLAISSGDLTLDAGGNANAVWIFQMASTLTTTSGRKVILSGSAKAANVFWQVGTSATLGTTSVFKGTIMADQSITLNTGASLEGRAFARIGAVTMAGNTIVSPMPSSDISTADITPPTVSFTNPVDGATGVTLINATFSEPMSASSINSTSFTVKGPGVTVVTGAVSYNAANNRASFVPSSTLTPGTAFTATITTGARDVSGNALAGNYVWHFSTVATDTTHPTVLSTNPIDGATGVVLIKVNVTFSEAMLASTINSASFTVKGPGTTAVAGVVTYNATHSIASFVPSSALALGTYFTATISTGVKDNSGNGLASNYVWHFTTVAGSAPATDTTHPTVLSTKPTDGATGVVYINATFSEAMLASTINSASFTVKGPGTTAVAGVVTYNATHRIASFVPLNALALGTYFTATITTGVKDSSGNALVSNYVWHFTTLAVSATQLPVVLASTANFVVLAGATITNTGPTRITGDLGLSPGSAVTGFPPGIIVGAKHVADPSAVQAKLDLTTAYNDAAGRTLAPITLSGNIGGMTLAPGLYKSTSGLAISSGDLTLDAGGNANAVWIFQIASTLTTTSGRKVILSGSANAANIYWQVGTSATLGTTSVFKGTIMADQSITLNTGASVQGRAFARIGAVTMASNAVVKP